MSSAPLYVGPFLHLRTLAAFEGFSNAQLRGLAYEAQEVLVPRGGQLIQRGEPVAAMYLIVDGFVDSGPGAAIGPGGVVGFLDVLASAPAAVGATAETDVVAFRLETDALRDVCEQNFTVLGALLTHVADRVADDRDALLRSVVGRSARAISADRKLDRVGRIVALHRSPAFPSHSMDALAELAGHLQETHVQGGEPLWSRSEKASGFFLVCSGSVQLGAPGWTEGARLGPGSVPGLVTTLAGRPYGYEAVAVEPTVLLRVGVEPFLDVIEDHFEMAFEMLGRLARNLIESGPGRSGSRAPVAEEGQAR